MLRTSFPRRRSFPLRTSFPLRRSGIFVERRLCEDAPQRGAIYRIFQFWQIRWCCDLRYLKHIAPRWGVVPDNSPFYKYRTPPGCGPRHIPFLQISHPAGVPPPTRPFSTNINERRNAKFCGSGFRNNEQRYVSRRSRRFGETRKLPGRRPHERHLSLDLIFLPSLGSRL